MTPGKCVTPGGSSAIPYFRLESWSSPEPTLVTLQFNGKVFHGTELREFTYEFATEAEKLNRLNDLFELCGK